MAFASGTLSRPTPCVEPEEDQPRARGHQADAQSLPGLSLAVEGKSEAHHEKAGQGQDIASALKMRVRDKPELDGAAPSLIRRATVGSTK